MECDKCQNCPLLQHEKCDDNCVMRCNIEIFDLKKKLKESYKKLTYIMDLESCTYGDMDLYWEARDFLKKEGVEE